MRSLVARCHLGLGKLYRRTGKREQAQEHLATATTMYREMGTTYWIGDGRDAGAGLGVTDRPTIRSRWTSNQPDFTQELPRKLRPTGAKERQSRLREKR